MSRAKIAICPTTRESPITGANGCTYTYDGDGNRVSKSNGTTGTLYWYMTPGVVAETDLAGTLKSEYVFFDGERVARRDGVNGAGGVAYYFSDHLKTASVITDSAGVIKAESDYYPWGGELQFVNNDSNDYKFTGKKRDTETGLDYFGARYYSNALGRWVSADWSSTPVPVPYADFGNPQSLNLYGFVGGNPASKADPDGHDWPSWSDVGQFIAGTANAYGSNNLLGAGRVESDSLSYKLGQVVGDGASVISGLGEVGVGTVGEGVGVALDATGVGAIIGIPVNVAAAGVIAHGVTTSVVGGVHLVKDASQSSGSGKSSQGPKSENAPGVSAGGQATDEHGNKLGGSGKPQQHSTESNTREGATNKALKQGSTAVDHSNPKQGKPHVHSGDAQGNKKPNSTHHNYPE